MEKLLRKIILWALKDKIKDKFVVLQQSKTMQNGELELTRYSLLDCLKKEVTSQIAREMLETNLIEFDRIQDVERRSQTITGKAYLLKI